MKAEDYTSKIHVEKKHLLKCVFQRNTALQDDLDVFVVLTVPSYDRQASFGENLCRKFETIKTKHLKKNLDYKYRCCSGHTARRLERSKTKAFNADPYRRYRRR